MDAIWLKTQFQLYPEKTRADLARALVLDPPAISKILGGMRQIKAHEYVAMRHFFGLPVEGERAVAHHRAYHLKALLHGLADHEHHDDHEAWIMPARLIEAKTKSPPEKIRIFSVKDKSMEPEFMVGSQVLVDLSDVTPSPPGVFVMSDGVGHVLRQCDLVPGETPLQIHAAARSGVSFRLAADKAHIVGRVIARLEWLV